MDLPFHEHDRPKFVTPYSLHSASYIYCNTADLAAFRRILTSKF
jgi:hypothetical protein